MRENKKYAIPLLVSIISFYMKNIHFTYEMSVYKKLDYLTGKSFL